MRLNLVFTLLLATTALGLSAQSGHDITIRVNGLQDTSGLLAYHYGDQKLVYDTIDFDSKGRVNVSGDEPLPRGMYLLVTPGQNYFEFIVADDQEFQLHTSGPSYVENMEIKGSKENELFYKDMHHIMSQRQRYEKLRKRHQQLQETNPDSAAILSEQMKEVDSEVRNYRKKLVEENPNTFYGTFLAALSEPDVPDVPVDEETGEADSAYPYRFFKKHYFDDFDFTEGGLVRTPVYHQKMKTYIKDLTPQIPDSIIKSADYLLDKTSQDSTLYQYTLAWMLNQYAKREVMGMDKVYVHLAEHYYMMGKAPWVGKNQMNKIIKDANALEPLLIGKTAPDISGKTRNGKTVTLHEFEAPYTIVAFWDADCGHCRKEIPKLHRLWEEKLTGLGVKVLAVSVEYTTDRWEEFLDEKELDGWTHIIDVEGRDDYRSKYNIKATPSIYVLDENKEIIAKWLGAEQIPDFIINYDKRKEKKGRQPTSFPGE